MSPKVTDKMLADAKKDGAEVTPIRKVQKLSPKPNATSNVASEPNATSNVAKPDELQALRDEISGLRAMVEETKSASDKRSQELSAIITALMDTKPVRVKPVRDLDPKSKTYLLVSHYDFIPVTHRKLDS